MSVNLTWNGDAVVETMRERSAKVLRLVAQSIVENVQEQLIPGHGELSGDLKKSYGYSIDQDEVNPIQPPAVDAIEKSLRLFVGSQWAYAFRIDQGFGSFSGYNQLKLVLDETSGDIAWTIKQVRHNA